MTALMQEGPATFTASGALTKGMLVQMSSAGVVAAAVASDDIVVGVVLEDAADGALVAVETRRGTIVYVQASTSITALTQLTATTAGQAVATTTAAARIFGQALQAATAQNQLNQVLLADWIIPDGAP